LLAQDQPGAQARLASKRAADQGRRLLHHADRQGSRAIIEKHDNAKPLFLYLSFNAPQAPLQATKEYLDLYKEVRDEQRWTTQSA
jgi:hypothetical protein